MKTDVATKNQKTDVATISRAHQALIVSQAYKSRRYVCGGGCDSYFLFDYNRTSTFQESLGVKCRLNKGVSCQNLLPSPVDS